MSELEADHCRLAEVENAIRDLKYSVGLNHLPPVRFAASGAWLAVQVMVHNLARCPASTGLGGQTARNWVDVLGVREELVMGVREIERFLEQQQMFLAPTPRGRERWYAI